MEGISDLQSIKVNYHTPGGGLSSYVNCMVEIEGAPYHEPMRNFPVIKSEVVFNLLEEPFQGESGISGVKSECKRATMRGIQTGWYDVMAGKGLHIFVINFKPEAYRVIFGLPADEMTNINVDAVLCLADLDRLWSRLMEAHIPEQRFAITEQWLTARIANSRHRVNPLFTHIKQQIDRWPQIQLKDLERDTGYSRQNLYSIFKKQMGIGIKQYMDILRLKRILGDMQTGRYINLATLALNHHFYDQNHFVKNIRRHTGMTPTQLEAQTLQVLRHNQSIFAEG